MTSPLAQTTVLVTRSAGQSSQFTDLLTAEGARVMEMPALEIGPPSHPEALDAAIADLAPYHWLILTSANAVQYFLERLIQQGRDTQALAHLKIAVVGRKTAATLRQFALTPDFIPPNYIADSLVESFPEPLAGKRILFPRVESGGREVLVSEFTAQGAAVTEVAAYESRCPTAIAPEVQTALQNREIHIITFASSKTVKHAYQLFAQAWGEKVRSHLAPICIASIGPQTSDACQQYFGRVDVEASEYTLEGLTQALKQWAATATSPSP